MRRDWKVVRKILEHIESEDLDEYVDKSAYAEELRITEDEFIGHLEILAEAGIIKNATVRRTTAGTIANYDIHGIFITMSGHDLLDALRDAPVWARILDKANRVGVKVSWEFIKAAIPVIMKELVA